MKITHLNTRKAWELIARSFIEEVQIQGKYYMLRMYPSYSTGICGRIHRLYLNGIITVDQYDEMMEKISQNLTYPNAYLTLDSEREARSLFCLLQAVMS